MLTGRLADPSRPVFLLGDVPPGDGTPPHKVQEICDKFVARSRSLASDGFIVYDIQALGVCVARKALNDFLLQDEPGRSDIDRPFPFRKLMDSARYASLLSSARRLHRTLWLPKSPAVLTLTALTVASSAWCTSASRTPTSSRGCKPATGETPCSTCGCGNDDDCGLQGAQAVGSQPGGPSLQRRCLRWTHPASGNTLTLTSRPEQHSHHGWLMGLQAMEIVNGFEGLDFGNVCIAERHTLEATRAGLRVSSGCASGCTL